MERLFKCHAEALALRRRLIHLYFAARLKPALIDLICEWGIKHQDLGDVCRRVAARLE
jgi:hypothetical protein